MKNKEHTLIQSYYREKYFISTAYRRASITIAEVWYYETIIWEWDKETKERGEMLSMEDSGIMPRSALENHFKLIEDLEL